MGKLFRVKFMKLGDMIYISHLDLQRLLHRAFRRAEINLSHSQGFNPHPKMSYGNALALGTESYGEYVDVEVEDGNLSKDEFMEKIYCELPDGIRFVKVKEIDSATPSISSTVEFADYTFCMEVNDKAEISFFEEKVNELLEKKEIILTKKNKKGKLVEIDIRPLIKSMKVSCLENNNLCVDTVIATGSKQNLSTNLLMPKLIEQFGLDIDPLDVYILRHDLYIVKCGKLITPM